MFKSVLILTTVLAVNAAPPNTVRPCSLKDYKCIADNLSANSRCDPKVRGFIPPSYTLNNVRFEAPYFNASYVDNVLNIKNHQNCFVSEYFANPSTSTEVLAIDCPFLDFESIRTVYQHNSLIEDIVYDYKISGVYPLVRLTTTFNRANQMDLCQTFTFADVAVLPIFRVDPNQRSSNLLSRDLSFIPIYERETFFYRAKQLFRYFINSYICDYKCNA